MKTCKNYIARQNKKFILPLFPYSPITVIIPCYDEPQIISTLKSLWACTTYVEHLHVIVVINHSESEKEKVIVQNNTTETELNIWKTKNETNLRRLSILKVVFPDRQSGVGAARKIGMDEAINQYAKNNKDGIIVSLDADTLCAPNYLTEIHQHFYKLPKTNALIIRYEHPIDGIFYKKKRAIIQYELYLRYMTLAYRHIGHPDAFHTIGSAFAVKASAYCKQGGMNRRQAGEDFYFLQKILLLGQCYELQSTCVYPSSRTSDRVPFGTGKTVQEYLKNGQILQTYSFKAFEELRVFFDEHLSLYKITKEKFENLIYNNLGGLMKSWLIETNFFEKLEQINGNCASQAMFSKKFFENFSIFQIIKYLNFSHINFLQKVNIFHAVSCLPQANTFDFQSDEALLLSLRETMNKSVFAKQ